MRRAQTSFVVLCLVGCGLAPASACAGTFTRPVLLPSSERESLWSSWVFAMNSRGGAIATNGLRVYEVGPRARLGRSWPLRVEGGFAPRSLTLTLDDRGRVLAGLVYGDGSGSRPDPEHEGPPCCAHVALTSWQLGTPPPVAEPLQAVGAATDVTTPPLEPPQIAIGPTAVTALWSDEGNLYEAFGRFGGQLEIGQLGVPAWVVAVHLAPGPHGGPIAAWRTTEGLQAARVNRAGAVTDISRLTRLPDFGGDLEGGVVLEDHEFSTNPEGDTTFGYATNGFGQAGTVKALAEYPRRAAVLAVVGPHHHEVAGRRYGYVANSL